MKKEPRIRWNYFAHAIGFQTSLKRKRRAMEFLRFPFACASGL